MKESLVESLKKLGLTEYEAKVYAALVGLGEATAREVHEASEVPRTRIYDVLRDLADKGFVEFIQGSPTYYRVVEPETVLEILRKELLDAIDISEKELKKLDLEVQGSSSIWCVRSEWAIKNRVRDFLKTVDGNLLIFCQNPDFLKEHRSQIGKEHLKMVIVDRADKFEGLGIDLLEGEGSSDKCPEQFPEQLPERFPEHSDLRLKLKELRPEYATLFQSQAGADPSYTVDCILIKEGKESLVVGKTGKEKMAVIMKLPLIAVLQKTFLGSITRE